MYKHLRKLSIIILLGMTAFTPFRADARYVLANIEGQTNSGEELGYFVGSEQISHNQRVFAYAVINQRETRENVAMTPWCRFGKVQLDERAIAFYFNLVSYKEAQRLAKSPGWVVKDERDDFRVIIADSSASKNLLRYACAQ